MDGIIVSGLAHKATGRGYLTSDHISTATGLDPAFTISKNGGNFANPAAGASVMTEIESTGWYFFALAAGDTDTVGPLICRGTHATMDNIEVVFQVVSATRGLAGTAVPDAVADAAGGLMISDDGGWDADELYDAIVTDAAGANIAIDIIAIKAETALTVDDTDDIGVAGAGLTDLPEGADIS